MDAVLGFLNNPAVLTVVQFLWGLAVKYHPSLAKWPNWTIPLCNAVVALLVALGAPQAAHAGIFGSIAVPGLLGTVLNAGWSAIQTSLIYEFFGRGPIEAIANRNKITPA